MRLSIRDFMGADNTGEDPHLAPNPLGPLSYTDAVIAIAARDPALAAILIHHHDCIEDIKRDGRDREKAIYKLTRAFDEWSKFASKTLLTICGTLVVGIAGIGWAMLTHPHGFAQ